MPNKPIVLATWQGSEPSLPSVLLNSHYDVVGARFGPVAVDSLCWAARRPPSVTGRWTRISNHTQTPLKQVPAVTDHWHTDPFLPTRKDGKIYARGTQDMKSVCAQYILAVERLKTVGGCVPLLCTHNSHMIVTRH